MQIGNGDLDIKEKEMGVFIFPQEDIDRLS